MFLLLDRHRSRILDVGADWVAVPDILRVGDDHPVHRHVDASNGNPQALAVHCAAQLVFH